MSPGGAADGPVATDALAAGQARGAVVVVSYGSSALLRDNLATFDEDSAYAVVVVDNFRDAAERDAVRALAEQRGWHLVCSPNRGYGAGVNRGVERAVQLGARAVVVANPDLHADRAVVRALLEHSEGADRTLVVPASRRPDGRTAPSRGSLDLARGVTRTSAALPALAQPWLSGSCLACSTALWLELDGMDEDLFMYWEDVDLSYRADRRGCRLEVRDDLVVTHSVGGTQGATKSPLYYYYNCRNRLLFARRHLPLRTLLVWAVLSLPYLRRVVLREGRRRVLTQPRQTLLPALRGTVAGLLRALEPGV